MNAKKQARIRRARRSRLKMRELRLHCTSVREPHSASHLRSGYLR